MVADRPNLRRHYPVDLLGVTLPSPSSTTIGLESREPNRTLTEVLCYYIYVVC